LGIRKKYVITMLGKNKLHDRKELELRYSKILVLFRGYSIIVINFGFVSYIAMFSNDEG
jgi:hypothetical protein